MPRYQIIASVEENADNHGGSEAYLEVVHHSIIANYEHILGDPKYVEAIRKYMEDCREQSHPCVLIKMSRFEEGRRRNCPDASGFCHLSNVHSVSPDMIIFANCYVEAHEDIKTTLEKCINDCEKFVNVCKE